MWILVDFCGINNQKELNSAIVKALWAAFQKMFRVQTIIKHCICVTSERDKNKEQSIRTWHHAPS
jgi:ribosomal protein S5